MSAQIPPVIAAVRMPRRRSYVWLVWGVLLLPVLLASGMVLGVLSLVRLDANGRALRNVVLAAAPSTTGWPIEVSVGSLSCGLLRCGLSLVDLEPEARQAVSALRGGQAGVYRFASRLPLREQAVIMAKASEAMKRRGWETVVRVQHEGHNVAVFMPINTSSPERLETCVLTLMEEQAVIAGGTVNSFPLLELASRRVPVLAKAGF